MSAFTDKVASQCLTEFARFNNGKGKETKDPFAGFVGEYWSFGLNNHNIDGRTTFEDSNGKPFRPAWSAAFICFIMRKSGAGDAFFYDEGHIQYVVKAIRDAKVAGTTAKFLGRNPKTQVPKVGDLINAGRAEAKSVTFANVLSKYGTKPVPNGNFLPSHSDIVIAVDVDETLEDVTLDTFRAVGSVTKRVVTLQLAHEDAPLVKQADIVIHPNVNGIGLIATNKDKAREAMDAGEKATREAIPAIKKAIQQKNSLVELP